MANNYFTQNPLGQILNLDDFILLENLREITYIKMHNMPIPYDYFNKVLEHLLIDTNEILFNIAFTSIYKDTYERIIKNKDYIITGHKAFEKMIDYKYLNKSGIYNIGLRHMLSDIKILDINNFGQTLCALLNAEINANWNKYIRFFIFNALLNSGFVLDNDIYKEHYLNCKLFYCGKRQNIDGDNINIFIKLLLKPDVFYDSHDNIVNNNNEKNQHTCNCDNLHNENILYFPISNIFFNRTACYDLNIFSTPSMSASTLKIDYIHHNGYILTLNSLLKSIIMNDADNIHNLKQLVTSYKTSYLLRKQMPDVITCNTNYNNFCSQINDNENIIVNDIYIERINKINNMIKLKSNKKLINVMVSNDGQDVLKIFNIVDTYNNIINDFFNYSYDNAIYYGPQIEEGNNFSYFVIDDDFSGFEELYRIVYEEDRNNFIIGGNNYNLALFRYTY